ncbi:hypothetical protein ACFYO2_48845 [Streptomyces sp. NPDC006602]|uniref:hypothetical protein n=1 Tax=Streptomyces sp. NPDC006602 TaxID=3364751 RepID=UPI0036B6CB9F
MTTHRADPAPVSAQSRACLHIHALFLDTQLDIVLSPGLGRRMRADFTRLVTGGGDGPKAGDASGVPQEARVFEEKGTAR